MSDDMGTLISRLLVANRGEIARRVMRTCRTMGIETVAVYSDPDAGSPFVAEADLAVPLGGAAPAESYLRADAIVEAARLAGADAVHPGYGFLSEDAGFARAVLDAGLTWIGPPPEAIASMGSKLAAREVMQAAGVPVLPGADLTGIDADDQPALLAAADRVGWPVLVKASAGGGGRGMRIVTEPDDLAAAVASARREAGSAFGDATVFLEHYVERPRHIEVQVFADTHGTVVHLFERECSIQRRHQKIIEEAPSPAITPALRDAMGDAAVRAAAAIGYVGAGTVEFILSPDGSFHFLEMNTRLQVEHAVTEAITGLDLVALQIEVAQGAPLPDEVRSAGVNGHAIEVRLYAEDPTADYLPTPGTLDRFEVPDAPGLDWLRLDSGVRDGDVISAHYDPMIAKLIVHADTRDDAIRRLAWALRRTLIHGVVTNRELLLGVCDHPEFQAGDIDTAFLERHPPSAITPRPTPRQLGL
ncbi:MAG: ATP-grasp domain-containing protein, partial [Acidimicrobiales bacterium]|nr:ATP-grasp domain-containing protein [Acidimicrobiales bacterium]